MLVNAKYFGGNYMLKTKMERRVARAKVNLCRWCEKPLPDNYHLLICPKCRKDSIEAYKSGKEELKKVVEVTVARRS